MTETKTDPMSKATEAVRAALISATAEGGVCNSETLALLNQAVSTWETVESAVCADLKKQLAEASALIVALHKKIEEQQADAAYQARQHAKFINEAGGIRENLDTNVLHWREQCGKLEARLKIGSAEHAGVVADLAKADEKIKELHELIATMGAQLKREIRLGYDTDKQEFTVIFGSGQEIRFDRPREVAGNVENWLANLRRKLTS